jgi:tRNA-dihydrouridine synthase
MLKLNKKTIWQKLERPIFILAPMEAVTDTVFRRVVIKAGRPDLFFTEFTNVEGWNSEGQKVVGRRLSYTPEEKPLIAQVWGSNPKNVAKMSKDLKKMGFDGIDLNMGCPVKTATKHASGSALILNPKLAGEMIQAAKKGGLPVSVKTRLGYTKPEEWRDWLGFLLQQDIAALTVHARTKKEMSKVPAHHELFGKIVKLRDELAPKTLLFGNGDIETKAQGEKLIRKHGLDGVMIGRGIFQNITCFRDEPLDLSLPESKKELLELLKYHLDLFEEEVKLHPGKRFDPLKRFFKIYVRDFEGASDLRVKLMDCKTVKEVRKVLSCQV